MAPPSASQRRRMDPLIIPLHDRRLVIAERLDLVGHGVAALGLLTAAMDRLPASGAGDTALVTIELAAAAAMAVAIVREARGGERVRTARIGWLNLLAAAVLFTEWYVRWSGGGKAFSPILLSGIATAALAFLHPIIQRRRHEGRVLRIDDDGISLQLGRFRRFSARWSELRAVDAAHDALRFVDADGRERRVRLRMITNRADVVAAVVAAADRRGLGADGGGLPRS